MDERTTSLAVQDRISPGPIENGLDGPPNLLEEFFPQSLALGFVPIVSTLEIGTNRRAEEVSFHRDRARI